MPICLDPNPLNACCSSAGPPLNLQIILNSVVIFQFGQKLHQNHCMEGQCTITSLSSPLLLSATCCLKCVPMSPLGTHHSCFVANVVVSSTPLVGSPQQNLSCSPSITALQKEEETAPTLTGSFSGFGLVSSVFFNMADNSNVHKRKNIELEIASFQVTYSFLLSFSLSLTKIFLSTIYKFFLLQLLEYNH